MPINDEPHVNKLANILMRILFNVDSQNIQFYQDVLDKAGFFIQQTIMAGNYTLFIAAKNAVN